MGFLACARYAVVVALAVLGCINGHSAEIDEELQAKYGKRLRFSTDMARRMVYGFDIDCEFNDGRYLPLTNLLLMRLSLMDEPKLWVVTSVDLRGSTARITDTAMNSSGPLESQLIMEINQWDELRLIGISAEAIRNACSGYWGKIWRLPKGNRK